MSSTTATVETLTAEVRCLQVGSRQITLSVYRQLDFKPPTDMTVFGRVRASRDMPLGAIELVGSHDGTLCRSVLPQPTWCADGLIGARKVQHWLSHTDPRNAGQGLLARFGRLSVQLDFNRYGRINPPCSPIDCCYVASDTSEDSVSKAKMHALGNHCGIEKLESEAMAEIEQISASFEDDERLYESVSRMPLIVLAGLK